MNIPLRAALATWVAAMVQLGSTDFAHAQFVGGYGNYYPREQIFTRAKRGLSAAELAPILLDDDPDSRRTMEKMSRRVSLNVGEMSVRQFAEKIARENGLQIVIDYKSFDEAHVTDDMSVAVQVDQVPLRQALALAFDPLELKCEVRGKIVFLTTEERSKTMHIKVAYPVFDLIATSRKTGKGRAEGAELDFDTLMTLIQETVHPDSWEEAGGPGRISPFPASSCLVLLTTRDVHIEVEQLLTALRKAKGIQRIESYSVPLQSSTSSETVDLTSRSLGTRRSAGPKRAPHQPAINIREIQGGGGGFF